MGIRGYPPVGLGLDGWGRHAPFLVLRGLVGVDVATLRRALGKTPV